MAGEIEFDWDDGNTRHLRAHRVSPAEFEQLLNNDPLDLDYQVVGSERRYRSIGLTGEGRCLCAVWTVRGGKVRAITAFPAGISERKMFLERSR